MACAASRLVLKMVSSKLRTPTKAAGIHIDRRHGFGLIDDQVTTRLQVNAPRQGPLDFILDTV